MVKRGDVVTLVDNKTGKETTGRIISYSKETIELIQEYNAKQVHFKGAKHE